MKSNNLRFYRRDLGLAFRGKAFDALGYSWRFWRPSFCKPLPPGSWAPKYWIWFIFDLFKIFHSASYGVLVALRDGVVCHRSCVFPRFFRFPFMTSKDLQVGDVWTRAMDRGKGLATCGLQQICSVFSGTGAILWYLVDDTNNSSIRVAEKMGFELIGFGKKRSRFGCRFLGYYEIKEYLKPNNNYEGLV
jgi:L-amino acid N-acyltransferase YncA